MANCTNCASTDVVGFTLSPSGQALHLTHCRACEHRWWASEKNAATVGLPDVLSTLRAA